MGFVFDLIHTFVIMPLSIIGALTVMNWLERRNLARIRKLKRSKNGGDSRVV